MTGALVKCVKDYVNEISTTGNGTTITTNQGSATNYENNVVCQWQVTAPVGFIVVVTFNEFSAPTCGSQCVDVFSVYGTWTKPCFSSQVCVTTANALFSAGVMPTTQTRYFLTANPVLLTFTSDGYTTGRGVNATITYLLAGALVKCVNGYVNVISTTGNGTSITTNQGNGTTYANNVICQWQVTAPVGFVVVVKFCTFAGEPAHDFFRVYGTWTTPCSGNQTCATSISDAVFSAESMPTIDTQYFLTANPVLLKFTSDAVTTNNGVTAIITFQLAPCPANSVGTHVVSGCACNNGFLGTVVPSTSPPYYTGPCVAQTSIKGMTFSILFFLLLF